MAVNMQVLERWRHEEWMRLECRGRKDTDGINQVGKKRISHVYFNKGSLGFRLQRLIMKVLRTANNL